MGVPFCYPGESLWPPQWRDHGVSHCFLESVCVCVPALLLLVSAPWQLAYYRRYAAPSTDYRQPNTCSVACQTVVHALMAVLPLVRLLVTSVWLQLPPDDASHRHQLYGFQVLVAVASCVSWLLVTLLVRLERRQLLPSTPGGGHGLPLLLSWTLLLAAELLYIINCRSAHWWFIVNSKHDVFELVCFVLRVLGATLAMVIGLKAPGLSSSQDYIPFLRNSLDNTRLSPNGRVGNFGNAAGSPGNPSPSVWRGFYRKMCRLMPFIWPRANCVLQFTVVLCFFLLLLSRVVNVFGPIYSKYIVDELSAVPAVFPWRDICVFVALKFLMGGGTGSMGLLNNARSLLWIKVQQFTEREVQVELFAHLHKLSLRWHLSRKTGEVLRVMDRGTSSINTLLAYICFQILPTFIDIVVAVAYFSAAFNGWFGFIVFITMVLYLAATIVITEWRTKYRREANLLDNAQRARGVDSLLNFETVKYYDAEQYEVQRYRHAVIDRQEVEWKSQASLNVLNTMQNVVINGGLLAGSLLCAHIVADHGSLTAGDYVLFMTYIAQLYTPLNWFGTYYRMIQQNLIDMENMLELLQEEQEVVDLPGAGPLQLKHGRLELRNVSFHYQPERPILRNISFCIEPGHTVALVGPSGAGKSTIVRLLFRLYDVCDGRILVDNQDIKFVQQSSVRRSIGVVPQDTVLFNDTIRYNVRYGRIAASDEDVVVAAKAADLHHRIVTFPDQYDTQVGERGLKLSGGEKQRVAIARTLLKAPAFVLLDEATSALDTQTERNIQASLKRVCSGRTTLIVAHRLSTIIHANQILVIKDGRIVERGSHEELLDKEGVYASMWRQQSEAEATEAPSTAGQLATGATLAAEPTAESY